MVMERNDHDHEVDEERVAWLIGCVVLCSKREKEWILGLVLKCRCCR